MAGAEDGIPRWGIMDALQRWLDKALEDPAIAFLAFVITLLVRLRVWEWLPKRRKVKHPKRKGGATA